MRAVALTGLIIVGCGASSAFLTLVANSQSLAPIPLTPAQSTTATVNDERVVPRGNEKPSFDCAQAKSAPARLICADAELAQLDGELGVAFQKRKAQISTPDQSKLVADQLAWIRARNTRCDLDGKGNAAIEVLAGAKPCMEDAIRERIAFLTNTVPTAAPPATEPLVPLPSRAGAAPNVGSDDMDEAVAAYYGCVRRVAAAMALASGEPAETIAKGAQGSCSDELGKLNNVLTLMRSAGALTDLGLTKLTETAEEQASNRAVAAVIAARALVKDRSDRAEAFANCTVAKADAMALASSEPAEKVAKAAVALCWKEAQAFAEADARTVGRHASTDSIEEAESIASRALVARIVAARSSRLH